MNSVGVNALLANTNEKFSQKFRKLSAVGSNNREKEENTLYYFEFFLKDLDDGRIPDLVLKELLIFVTGADAVPPPGFTSALPISFYDMENDVKRLPYTSTCNMSLSVARGLQEPKNFNELMYGTTLGCFGFGKC